MIIKRLSFLTIFTLAGFFSLFNASEPSSSLAQNNGIIVATDYYGVKMVYVPEGDFEFGVGLQELIDICVSHEEKYSSNLDCERDNFPELNPGVQEIVHVLDFWIDQYEVTNEAYQTCVDIGACDPVFISESYQDRENNAPDKPLVGATWYQALSYCEWRVARLLTEIEWEYAASGPENLALPSGGHIEDEYIMNLNGSNPVGSNSVDVSWVGAYDMGHNVHEWVEDRYVPFNNFVDDNISRGEADLWRVIRGGSWTSFHASTYTFYRRGSPPEAVNHGIGFRCARFTDPQP